MRYGRQSTSPHDGGLSRASQPQGVPLTIALHVQSSLSQSKGNRQPAQFLHDTAKTCRKSQFLCGIYSLLTHLAILSFTLEPGWYASSLAAIVAPVSPESLFR